MARRDSLEVFLLGGVAVRVRTPIGELPLLSREFNDIDIVTSRAAGKGITRFVTELGYLPDREFNAVNGRTRLLFHDTAHTRDLDVLVGEFEMCHVLPILEQAKLSEPTIPLADLLLTKLQIVQITHKDVLDIYNLLYCHEVRLDSGGDSINATRVAQLCAREWGLWRTVSHNLEEILHPPYRPEIASDAAEVVRTSVVKLRSAITDAKKSRRWRLRSRVGERVQWYEEPEEAH